MSLVTYRGVQPRVDPTAFVAPSADLIGDVVISEEASIWFGAVLRGDVEPIRIGARTSIQDNSVIHATGGWSPTHVGRDCTVGHSVVLHGCTVGDRCLIGMGSIVLDGAVIGDDVILGAGSLVTARTEIESGMLAFGRPAKVIRCITDDEWESVIGAAARYAKLGREYRS